MAKETVLGDLAEDWVVLWVTWIHIACLKMITFMSVCFCRWQSIFRMKVWSSVAVFWNKVFLTMILILVVLFIGKWNNQCPLFLSVLYILYAITPKLELRALLWLFEVDELFRNINSELAAVGGEGAGGWKQKFKTESCTKKVHSRRGAIFHLSHSDLTLDAVREVRKYSGKGVNTEAKLQPNMYDHMHMKLFRAQRNLYISGFAVFLWLWVPLSHADTLITKSCRSRSVNKLTTQLFPLAEAVLRLLQCVLSFCRVMKRVITLINQLATVSATTADLQTQADTANLAAKKYMEDNELLKQVDSILVKSPFLFYSVVMWGRITVFYNINPQPTSPPATVFFLNVSQCLQLCLVDLIAKVFMSEDLWTL